MTRDFIYLVVTPAGAHHFFGSLAAIYDDLPEIDVSIHTLYRHSWTAPYTTKNGYTIRRGAVVRKTKK
jgi:hypothetical protein